jgi:hypothetical protein
VPSLQRTGIESFEVRDAAALEQRIGGAGVLGYLGAVARRPLAGQAFDPETIKTMSAVLERICAEIGVTLGGTGKNPAAEIIAAKIIEHAQRGVKTQTQLYLATMAGLKPDDGSS